MMSSKSLYKCPNCGHKEKGKQNKGRVCKECNSIMHEVKLGVIRK